MEENKHKYASNNFKNNKSLFGIMEKKKRNQIGFGVLVILVVALLIIFSGGNNKQDNIKIGVITDLSGPASYWGESTVVGAKMAAKELRNKGHNVELVFEDAQLSSEKALSAAQKLINVDNVDAIYAEFNPASTSVGSFVRGKDVLYVYDAAIVSPLENNPNAFKTYLDYEKGCRKVAKEFKQEGIKKLGMLKVNQEYGELCLDGAEEVYGENLFVESYNLGQKDLSTQILKLSEQDVGAIINVGFEGDTLNTLRVLKEQGLDIRYGTVEDTITENVESKYPEQLEDSITFGFRDPSENFTKKISDEDLSTNYGAALAYTHIRQIGNAFSECGEKMSCVRNEMKKSGQDGTIGFKGFENRIANLSMSIKER
ncbi:MAG: ABC transporter substrate-binding protein [Candidatus Pacearchaeota archaeon]